MNNKNNGDVQGTLKILSNTGEKSAKLFQARDANKHWSYDELLHELRICQDELEIQNQAVQQSQRALEKSRAHYIELYDYAPVGYLTLDAQGVITEINFAAAKLLGIKRDALVNQPFAQFIADDYKAIWHRHFTEVKGNAETHGCELPFRNENATLLFLHLDCLCVNTGNVEPLTRITLTNVTERKKSEEVLRIAAATFDIAEGIFVADADNLILRVNEAFTKITGYSPEEAFGISPIFLRSNLHDDAFYGAKWESIRQEGYWQGEIWDKRKNGEVFPMWLTITAVKNAEGQITHYVGAFSDITARKQAEESLRIAAAAFQTQAGIIVTDAHKSILRVNQAFTRITGYSAEYAIGKTPFFLRSGLHDNDFYEALWAVVLRDGYWQGEIWNKHYNGALYPVLQSITAVTDKQGVITHYVGSFTDITAQKKAEMILRDARDRLQNQVASTAEELKKIMAETAEVNTALNVLLRYREGDKFHAQIALSKAVETTILPFLQKLKGVSIGRRQTGHLVGILETNLKQLVESYGRESNLLAAYQKLTPLEAQVASMIRQGLPTKVIASTLNISSGTVSIHRKHIRKKFDLDSKAINLHSYLLSLAE